jgi:ubiquinone/menaquinone biosynthesis C-methylase UbiE
MLQAGLAKADAAAVANLHLIRGDAHDLPVSDAVLSGVNNQGALHLYADPGAVLRQVARVLTPGGVYVGSLEVQSRRWLARGLQNLLRRRREPFWEETRFRGSLEKSGFMRYERILLGHLLLFRVVKR